MFFFNIYHQLAKQKSSELKKFPRHHSTWPDEWKTTVIKQYERFSLVKLPKPTSTNIGLFETIIQRRTRRDFGKVLDEQKLSNFIFHSIGETNPDAFNGIGQRVYPSAGARYPLEFYFILFKEVGEIRAGIYHYDILAHGLRRIRDTSISDDLIKKMVNYPFVLSAKGVIVFTACFSRSSGKYGERAYRYIMIEAGGVMQNFSLVGTALGIDTVSIGSLSEDILEPLLDIDGSEESFVHSIFFG